MDGGEALFNGMEPFARAILNLGLPGRLVEINWRLLELVKDEEERPQQQNQKLHGDLEHGIEHQAQPAFAQG